MDLDPKIREVFTALDDEEYVESDLEDDFFDSFNAEQVPEKYVPSSIQKSEDSIEDDDEEGGWMTEFKK